MGKYTIDQFRRELEDDLSKRPTCDPRCPSCADFVIRCGGAQDEGLEDLICWIDESDLIEP